jgi:signal transduction histidine kinase
MTIQNRFYNLFSITGLFMADAALLWVAGLYLFLIPRHATQFFKNEAWSNWSAVQMFGAFLLMAGFMAHCLSQTNDWRAWRYGILTFTPMHFLIAILVTARGNFGAEVKSVVTVGACDERLDAGPFCTKLFEGAGTGLDSQFVGAVAWLMCFLFGAVLWYVFPQPNRRSALSITTLRSAWEMQIGEAAAQEERNRLARDLHDSIKQQIFAIQTSVSAARVRLENGSGGVEAALDDARQSAKEASVEMASMIDQLTATPLENQGLVTSVRTQCEALGFRTGARVTVEIGDLPSSESLHPGAHQAAYRIAQETLSNIAKHARATEVKVRIGSGPGGQLAMTIQDNGQGFSVHERMDTGMGLRNLFSRAEQVNGSLSIHSVPGEGTTVELAIAQLQRPVLALHAVTFIGYATIAILVPLKLAGIGVSWWVIVGAAGASLLLKVFEMRRRKVAL